MERACHKLVNAYNGMDDWYDGDKHILFVSTGVAEYTHG